MDQLFSIGQVSSIFNISIHSLRHYHKIGLIVPESINEENGYRYYTFRQFHFISRFKYLRSIGLSLEQIRSVFESGKSEDLRQILSEIKEEKKREIAALQELFDKIDFITDYYSFNDVNDTLNLIYKKSFSERCLFTSEKHLNTIEAMDINLHKELYASKNKRINFMRQFSYVLDFEALTENEFKPLCTSVLLNNTNFVNPNNLLMLPAGDYVCYCTRILNEGFDIAPLLEYISRRDKKPSIAVAMEYEDNLHEYYNAVYEIQLFYTQ